MLCSGDRSRRHETRFVLIQSLVFVHSGDWCFGLSDEECLATRGVHVCVADVGQAEGSDACGVDEEGCRGEV